MSDLLVERLHPEGSPRLEADGTPHALELTGASSFRNPVYRFRREAPVDELARAFPAFVRPGFRLTASRFLPEDPFSEAHVLPDARQVREALSVPPVLLGGINRLGTVAAALAVALVEPDPPPAAVVD